MIWVSVVAMMMMTTATAILTSVASESKDGLKPGAIAGIVLSVLFLLLFVIAITILIKRRTSKQKAATESNSDNAENAWWGSRTMKSPSDTSTNKPEDAKNPWWGSRTMKSPSDTDTTVSAEEGKPNSKHEVDSSWWPSWMAADADPKSAKKQDIERPNTKNDEIVETGSSWWNACSIFT